MSTYEKLSSLFSDDLDLPSTLKQKGYQSVFDIVRQPKKIFIESLSGERINRQMAGAVYDTSAGLATQLYRQFLSTKHQVMDSPMSVGGLMKNGPTWQNLFLEDWSSYCLNNAPEANDSPVSYLAWLYNQALDFEAQMGNASIISLTERRPDLPQLVIDDAAINQVIPSLQLVNEVLESSIEPYIQEATNKTVNETLSVTRYPKNLPYHYPHQQTLLSLKNAALSLHEVIKKTDITWPWFTATDLALAVSGMSLVLGNNLAPEQQTILTEPDNASADDLTAFYTANYGTVTADYSIFNDVTFFTEQTKTTMPQLENMLAVNEGGMTVIGSPNVPFSTAVSPVQYGAVFINAPDASELGYVSITTIISQTEAENRTVESSQPPAYSASQDTTGEPTLTFTGLSDERMDRINRIIRLQRWLALPFDRIDSLLTCITDTSDNALKGLLRLLGAYRYYADTYHVSPEQFTAIIGNMASCAITPDVPFFDKIFNSPSLFETPFSITNTDFSYAMENETDARIVKQICAGLGINTQQFQIVADKVAEYQGDKTARTLSCSLAVVSALYRLVMLPRWLGYGFYDGMALLSIQTQAIPQLASVPVFNPVDNNGLPASGDILDTLVSLADLAQWLKDNTLTPGTILTLLQQPNRVFPATTAELNFVQGINQQLPATLLSETDFTASGIGQPVSTGETPFVSWMETLKSVVDNSNGLVMTVTAGAKTPYETLSDSVSAAIAGYTFTDMSNDDATRILTNIIWQARLEQNGIADSAIANTLQLNVSLSTLLLQWCGNSEYDFLCDTLALSDASVPEDISDAYLQELYQLGRRAAWCHLFDLTPACLTVYLTHPLWFGLADTTITLKMAYLFSQYSRWLALAGNEDRVLAYLSWVNSFTGDITPDNVEQAAQMLAGLISWDSDEVKLAAAHANSTGIAASLADVDIVMRVKTLAERSASSAQTMISTGALNTTSTWDDWQNVGEALIATQTATL